MEINKKLIGVDLGGTKVAVGKIFNGCLENVNYELIPSSSEKVDDTLSIIVDLIDSLIDSDVCGIGIGVPGMVDRKQGVVYDIQNIQAWKEVDLKRILEAKFSCPVYIDNDANCFALGEYYFGSNAGLEDFVGVSLGTGMGAGIIKYGHLLPDANCGSGEFGNIPYLDGIYEDYCSGKFFKRIYDTVGEKVTDEASQGAEWALGAFKEFGNHLGNAIKTIILAVDPQIVIIGGSVAKAKSFFEESMWKSILNFPFPNTLKNFNVLFSDTENVAVLGAASLYFDTHNRNKLKLD